MQQSSFGAQVFTIRMPRGQVWEQLQAQLSSRARLPVLGLCTLASLTRLVRMCAGTGCGLPDGSWSISCAT